MVEIIAQLRNLRMSPKKIRLVTDVIKGMDVDGALLQLQYTQKRSAPIVFKLLKSAIANAQHNNNISADKLRVKNVIVDEAIALDRWKPAAFGAAHPFKKRGSHIRLIVTLKPGVTIEEKKKVKKSVTSKKVETVKGKPIAQLDISSSSQSSSSTKHQKDIKSLLKKGDIQKKLTIKSLKKNP